jgi:site-specific DNA-methyltransferase (adenine-specific)
MIDLRKGDCLEVMKTIKDNSIDAIITDPPYGTTACKWDSVIPFDLMWEQLNRIIKPNGAIVLFGSEPFSSALRMSNIKNYKYDWVWKKNRASNFAAAKYVPLKQHEIISVFYKKAPTYNPIKIERTEKSKKRRQHKDVKKEMVLKDDNIYGTFGFINNQKTGLIDYDKTFRNPMSVIDFKVESNNQYRKIVFHPTQKPIALMEYLIKTYTQENETVLDFTMGSGSTMVACQNLKRNGIGIEQDEKYFKIAEQRIKENEYKLF